MLTISLLILPFTNYGNVCYWSEPPPPQRPSSIVIFVLQKKVIFRSYAIQKTGNDVYPPPRKCPLTSSLSGEGAIIRALPAAADTGPGGAERLSLRRHNAAHPWVHETDVAGELRLRNDDPLLVEPAQL